MSNAWFRMYSEFATDPKVQMMSEAMQRRLVVLMCLRCSDVTVTVEVTERDAAVAFALRIDEPELEATKALFIRKGFIDDQWNLLNWDRRQFASDSSAERMRKHRAAKKTPQSDASDGALRHGDAVEQIQNRTDTEEKQTRAVGENSTSPEIAAPSQSIASRACQLMIAAGIPKHRINHSHAKLLDAIAEGVTPQEFADAVPGALASNAANPFVWTIAVARGEHANRGSATPQARASPSRTSTMNVDFESIDYGAGAGAHG